MELKFINVHGVECALNSVATLLDHIRKGEIRPDTLVKDQRSARWIPARDNTDIASIFSLLASATHSNQRTPQQSVGLRNSESNAKVLTYDDDQFIYQSQLNGVFIGIFLVFGGLLVAAHGYTIWIIWQTHQAVSHYGFGHVPLEALPVRDFDKAASWIDAFSIASFIALWISFFSSIAKARRILELVTLNSARFKYSWVWTPITLFIPVAWFYRPWVGLAEIHRTSLRSAEHRTWLSPQQSGSGSRETWGLALITIAVVVGARVIERLFEKMSETSVINTTAEALSYSGQARDLAAVLIGLFLGLVIYMLFYLIAIRRSLLFVHKVHKQLA